MARTLAGGLERRRLNIVQSPTIHNPLAQQTHAPMVLGPLEVGLSKPKENPFLRCLKGDWQLKPANRALRFIGVGVGRLLMSYKGFDLLIEATAGDEKLRRCEMVLVGEGPETKARMVVRFYREIIAGRQAVNA